MVLLGEIEQRGVPGNLKTNKYGGWHIYGAFVSHMIKPVFMLLWDTEIMHDLLLLYESELRFTTSDTSMG